MLNHTFLIFPVHDLKSGLIPLCVGPKKLVTSRGCTPPSPLDLRSPFACNFTFCVYSWRTPADTAA